LTPPPQGDAEGPHLHHLHSTASKKSPTATPSLRSWRTQDQQVAGARTDTPACDHLLFQGEV